MNSQKKTLDLIAFDFDGVFTNNQALVLEDGTEGVFVNRSDGLAINQLRLKKYPMVIISTEKNRVVEARAKKLKIPVFTGVNNKAEILKDYCKKKSFSVSRTIFVGNDINDKEVMDLVGYPICPNDAHDSIKNISTTILKTKGGYGAIRELLDLVINTYESE
jgi:3-deoxy-D-manno-octulosonate 8-phosphate phosphatase (KDO 8-P phosphatase)